MYLIFKLASPHKQSLGEKKGVLKSYECVYHRNSLLSINDAFIYSDDGMKIRAIPAPTAVSPAINKKEKRKKENKSHT